MIRILLVDMPRLLQDVVTRILEPHADLEVVVPAGSGSRAVLDLVRGAAAEVVVTGVRGAALADLLAQLVQSRSPSRVLAVADDGQHALLCTPLGDLSPDGLLAAIRAPYPNDRRPSNREWP